MLQETDVKASTSADGFFKKVMETTDTIISWPTKLKANVKSKKDPHVKVCGSSEAVGKARESILEVLDTKRNRVTMKMDVSFTDHSYIIGKGGHNIQQVMDNTGCHIHFPDSNRNSHMDKSNQVSIAGTPSGVESARNQIRELLPMVVSFELPLNLALPSALDPSSMALQGILKSHGITVTFRPLHNSLTLVVVVKGSRRYVDRLRQGLLVLVEYLTGGTRTQVGLVTLSMEIAPHHHGFVMGHGNSNVLQIARQTGCVITFPDPVAVANQPPSVLPTFLGLGQQTCPQGRPPVGIPSKSTVQITGNFDAVHNAWLELMDRLPLVLMFDLKENQAVDMLAVYKLMDHMNVHISVKPKPKRNSRSAVVRCPERDSRLLFEVRRIILSLDTDELGSPSPSFIDKISYSAAKPSPKGSMMPDPTWWEIQAASQHHAAAAAAASRQQQHQQQQLFLSGLLAGNPFIGHPQPMAGPQQQQQQAALLPLLLGQLFQGPRPGLFDPSVVSSLTSRPSVCIPPSETLPSPNHSSSYGLSSSAHSYPGSQESRMDSGYGFSLHDEGHLSTSDEVTSCHTWEDSMNDMEGKESWKKSHEHGSPPSGNQRSLEEIWADSPMFEYQRGMAPVGCERKVSFGSPLPHLDYERRKLLATKAMQEHVGCTKRVPSSTWSGFGFSKSMPESMVKGQLQQNGTGTTSGRQAKLEEPRCVHPLTRPRQVKSGTMVWMPV
uniref:Putative vigilin n=1 Tax=Amblyomma triste TaxID=251400 RepID=A0A023GGC7_AMBTT